MAGIDLIDQQVDSSQALHRLKYLNIKDLFIHIRYIHLENIDLQSLTTGMWQVFQPSKRTDPTKNQKSI